MTKTRLRYRITGLVQGVGFRPAVWRLAHEMGLSGEVFNDSLGVVATVQGDSTAVARFPDALRSGIAERAPLAHIEGIVSLGFLPVTDDTEFKITVSEDTGHAATQVSADACYCADCAREMLDAGNRRYRYPFINCTHCGPRYTITRHIPYDRAQTSMAYFVQCPACQSEYDSPADRRFHAQPNACSQCGPHLALMRDADTPIVCADVIAEALRRILDGQILAIKGLGGFHLVCDAANAAAVQRLRERKHREEKPLALMVANTASARRIVRLSAAHEHWLNSRERPIVLAPKRPGVDRLLAGIAPGLNEIGVMLPYTPLHLLLFYEARHREGGFEELTHEPVALTLVMTSANTSDEPLVKDNDAAYAQLAGLADAFVVHDRPIVIRCDDSVLRCRGEVPQLVRRARGFAPQPVDCAELTEGVVATGASLKVTACVCRDGQGFLTQHIGDTANLSSCQALEQAVDHYLDVLQVTPRAIVCDKHPDFFSTHLARRLAQRCGAALFEVQHHHAHIAAVAAEAGLRQDVAGLALDGVGYGDDGTAWGGELLALSGTQCRRLGHLLPIALPGGDAAAREPWRLGVSLCHALGMDDAARQLWPDRPVGPLLSVLGSARLSPVSSAMGRYFDAAAAIAGVCSEQRDEARAAMLLESLACPDTPALAQGWRIGPDNTLDLSALFRQLIAGRLQGRAGDELAGMFHATLVQALTAWVTAAVPPRTDLCLAGGCFLNHFLNTTLSERLDKAGYAVHQPVLAPPGDGAVSLGQALIGSRRLNEQH